jgi:hypothetical protein
MLISLAPSMIWRRQSATGGIFKKTQCSTPAPKIVLEMVAHVRSARFAKGSLNAPWLSQTAKLGAPTRITSYGRATPPSAPSVAGEIEAAMQSIIEANIERFKLLTMEADPTKRAMEIRLLAEKGEKLAKMPKPDKKEA